MSLRITFVPSLILAVVCALPLKGQQAPAAASVAPAILEFPVILQQSVETGKTPVGTKIQARLVVATLVDRVVIPKDAVLSGVVIESEAKTKNHPARLSIRIDSVQWKTGSASVKAYLTPWYYPTTVRLRQSLQYGPPEPAAKTWNGAGQYPSTDSRVYQPFPGTDSDNNPGPPNTPFSTTSNRRSLMKNVAIAPTGDGGIALVSRRANLKLDKLTNYVLAAAMPPGK